MGRQHPRPGVPHDPNGTLYSLLRVLPGDARKKGSAGTGRKGDFLSFAQAPVAARIGSGGVRFSLTAPDR